MAKSKPILGYWGIRGLCQPIRLLAAYLNLEVEEKRYFSMEEWEAEKFTLGLTFPNLPYLIDNEVKLTESRAILKYIAREQGSTLYPQTLEAKRTCDMLENVMWDIWLLLLRYCNTGSDTLKTFFDVQTPKKLGYLNTFMESKNFILGEQISYVDFILYEILYHFTAYEDGYLEKYPALLKFKKSFEEIPIIDKYISSSQYIKGPCNNPRAKIAF